MTHLASGIVVNYTRNATCKLQINGGQRLRTEYKYTRRVPYPVRSRANTLGPLIPLFVLSTLDLRSMRGVTSRDDTVYLFYLLVRYSTLWYGWQDMSVR